MGLLMVEALLSLEGARCISLGAQMPLVEIAHAAAAHRADIVALSFSAAFPARQVPNLLRQLRDALPATTMLGPAAAGRGALPRPKACALPPRWTTESSPLRSGATPMGKTPRRRTTHRRDVAERCGLILHKAPQMRLWSLHPRYLDPQGLVALWREALLARAVLCANTRGYRSHPQLERFRSQSAPRSAISCYLNGIYAEAARRGYSFDGTKIGRARIQVRILVGGRPSGV